MDQQISDKGKKKLPTVDSVKSSTLKLGAKTIFFDVNVASNDKKYLKITVSRFTGEGSERVRSSLVLFPEDMAGFQTNLKEMVAYL